MILQADNFGPKMLWKNNKLTSSGSFVFVVVVVVVLVVVVVFVFVVVGRLRFWKFPWHRVAKQIREAKNTKVFLVILYSKVWNVDESLFWLISYIFIIEGEGNRKDQAKMDRAYSPRSFGFQTKYRDDFKPPMPMCLVAEDGEYQLRF